MFIRLDRLQIATALVGAAHVLTREGFPEQALELLGLLAVDACIEDANEPARNRVKRGAQRLAGGRDAHGDKLGPFA